MKIIKSLMVFLVFIVIVFVAFFLFKTVPAEKPGNHKFATFDVFCEFPLQKIAPGKTLRVPVDVRRVFNESFDVDLDIEGLNEAFEATLSKNKIALGGLMKNNSKRIFLNVKAKEGAGEGMAGHFKVTGKRGSEVHYAKSRIEVVPSLPSLRFGLDDSMVKEKSWKIAVHKRIGFRLDIVNLGSDPDNYELSAEIPDGWKIEFKDTKENQIGHIVGLPVNPRFLWEKRSPFSAFLHIPEDVERGREYEVVFIARSSNEKLKQGISKLKANVFVPERLHVAGLHPHYVASGSRTTFLYRVANATNKKVWFTLQVTDMKACRLDDCDKGRLLHWNVVIPEPEITLGPNSIKEYYLTVFNNGGKEDAGESLDFSLSAIEAGETIDKYELKVINTEVPKTYFVSIDSLNAEYVDLNSSGTGPGRDGDWLMPNVRSFIEQSVTYTNARADLPSMTDMNHTNALAGTHTGTSGIPLVAGYYLGRDEDDIILHKHPSYNDMKFSDGKNVVSIFDVYKKHKPFSTTSIATNKHWVTELHTAENPNMDCPVSGGIYPEYVDDPQKFVLGDPLSDDDHTDRKSARFLSMVEKITLPLVKALVMDMRPPPARGLMSLGEIIGSTPGKFPNDRWIMESSIRIIRTEDPDVMYINLAALDEAQHLMGSAWEQDEWNVRGTDKPEDDVSKYNPNARRGDVLDIVREADFLFGNLLKELSERESLDSSFIVFLADHGQVTYKDSKAGYELIDARKVLRQNGILSIEDYGFIESNSSYVAIFDSRNPETNMEMERVLEDYRIKDKEIGEVHPFVVLNTEEMKTGIDRSSPVEPGVKIAEPGELYSEWYIEKTEAPGKKLRWPDLIIFMRGNYQNAIYGEQFQAGINAVGADNFPSIDEAQFKFIGGHGNLKTSHIPIIFYGPNVMKGKIDDSRISLGDIVPTIYEKLGWSIPDNVDGKSLSVFNY